MIRFTAKSAIWRMGIVAAAGAGLLLAVACGGNDASLSRDKGGEGGTTGGPQRPADSAVTGSSALEGTQAYDAGKANGATAPESAPGGGSGTLPSLLDRKIIRTATVTLETEQVSARFEDVGNIAAGAGGFVASSSFGNSGDKQTASVTIRVPNDRYQDVLGQLRKLGSVTGEQSNASDVTEQYTDLDSRLRNLRATEAQYLEFLTRAENLNDVLTVQDRLNNVRAEIEQVQGRIQLLSNQADLATITTHLAPPAIAKAQPKDDGGTNPLEAAQNAWEASLAVLLGIATVGVAVVAFSWWLVLLAALVYIIARRQMQTPNRTP